MQTIYDATAATASPPPAAQLGRRRGLLARPVSATPAVGVTRRLDKNQELFGQGERAAFFYKVVSGALRTYRLLEDGRRQIGAFHLPGDIVGLEAREEHPASAEAVCKTVVLVYRRNSLDAAATGEGNLAREIVTALVHSLERAQDHLLLLGCKSAIEKLASFLLDMSRREGDVDSVSLSMSRVDVGDHLGLRIETVSRALRELERRLIIKAERRTIVLRDRAALHRLAGGAEA